MATSTNKSFTHRLIVEILKNLFILAIFTFISYVFFPYIKEYLLLESVKGVIDNIKSFLEMSIGIYIAVISILATARTSITEKLSEGNKHEIFIITISIGFIETVIALIFSNILLVDMLPNSIIVTLIMSITIALIIISIIQISRFFFAILLMFNITVSNSASEARSEEEKHKSIILILNKIQNRLDEIIKKLN